MTHNILQNILNSNTHGTQHIAKYPFVSLYCNDINAYLPKYYISLYSKFNN